MHFEEFFFDRGRRPIDIVHVQDKKDKKDVNVKEKEKDNPKKDPSKVMREEELLEQAVQPHKSPLGSAFIPVLLFTR